MKKTFVILILALVWWLVYSQYYPNINNIDIKSWIQNMSQDKLLQYYQNMLKWIENNISKIQSSMLPNNVKNSIIEYYEKIRLSLIKTIDELSTSTNLPENCPSSLFEQYSDLVDPVICKVDTISYGYQTAKVIEVHYGRELDYDVITTKVDKFLQFPDWIYYRPKDKYFLSPWSSIDYVKELTNQIWFNPNHWTNLQIDKISTKNIVKKNNNYCIQYIMKTPFAGELYICDNNIMEWSVSYQSGILSWKDAELLIKDKLSQITDTHVRWFNWSTPYSLVVFRNSLNGSIDWDLYWAVTYRGYENWTGWEKNYIVRVYMNKTVQIQEFDSTKQMYPDDLR